jgi:YjbE family integral membrane protein
MPDLASFDISHQALAALFQVIVIDLVLAGDNAVIIGLAAAGLPREQRTRAILVGIGAATVLRIGFAFIAVELLAIVGLIFAGGILLLWVSWKMWRELRAGGHETDVETGEATASVPRKSFAQAAWQIVAADISMSLDNVLAVAGAAREHPIALVFGLGLSIVLMGLAANFVARALNRYRWIAYLGLAIILYVALDMIWRGFWELHALATG